MELLPIAHMTEAEYFKGIDYTLEAVVKPGFKFKQWNVLKRVSTPVPLISTNDTWKYFDKGTLPATNWTTNAFNDASWTTGTAQLGYGDGDEQTVVSFGPDPNNKFITTYFRKTFTVADTIALDQITAQTSFDDGIVVYLNGTEVYRNNMPSGTVAYPTLAIQALPTENNLVQFTIPKGVLKPGSNVFAVEVHQNAVTSSDLSFEFSARTRRFGSETQEVITQATVNSTANTDLYYEAVFETDNRFVSGLVINEISAKPSGVVDNAGDEEDWIELYNAGTQTINLAGLYLTDNLSQQTKHIILPGTTGEMVMAPGQYKVFWADEEPVEGASHLSFKLSADGEAVGLYQKVDNVVYAIDELFYNVQSNTGSFSRIPNGEGPFDFTGTVTPGSVNTVVLSIPEETKFSVYPNPVSSSFSIQIRDPHYSGCTTGHIRSPHPTV